MQINCIKENCLYVSNLDCTKSFYHRILQLPLISYVEDRHVFFQAGESVLLCFLPEVTKNEKILPPHHAHGPQHLAFEVPEDEYQRWKERLEKHQIQVTHEQHWRDKLYSMYFRDPDGHILEILPPGIWE